MFGLKKLILKIGSLHRRIGKRVAILGTEVCFQLTPDHAFLAPEPNVAIHTHRGRAERERRRALISHGGCITRQGLFVRSSCGRVMDYGGTIRIKVNV
jgi:hypothetical protein